jgi:hypothetical protein
LLRYLFSDDDKPDFSLTYAPEAERARVWHSLEHVALAGTSLHINQSLAPFPRHPAPGGKDIASEHQPSCPDPDRPSPAAAMATSAVLSTAANSTQVSQQLPSSAAGRFPLLSLTLNSGAARSPQQHQQTLRSMPAPRHAEAPAAPPDASSLPQPRPCVRRPPPCLHS